MTFKAGNRSPSLRHRVVRTHCWAGDLCTKSVEKRLWFGAYRIAMSVLLPATIEPGELFAVHLPCLALQRRLQTTITKAHHWIDF